LIDPSRCVLGQSEDEGNYWITVRKLFPDVLYDLLDDIASKHGFCISEIPDDEEAEYTYAHLTEEWKAYITERRQSAKLKPS
jgi:hypothetical protein